MTELTPEQFLAAVIKSGLIDAKVIRERAEQLQMRRPRLEPSAKELAVYFVQSKDLTKYQVERLLAGKCEGFFLGDCKILDRLGKGGMGKVYLAEQLKLGRLVALKVLPQQFADDREYLARFDREARAAAKLKHNNIVQVYDVGCQGRIHYMVMELVQGKNLKALLFERGPFSVEQTVDIVMQAARGLAHAHEHGIVHRDIKPSNLMLENEAPTKNDLVCSGQTLKIVDLGLARPTEPQESITHEARGMGTPDYMSPEQFIDASHADARSDIYSLGCTWYELLSGRPPFAAAAHGAKILAHQLYEPEPIHSFVPALSDTLAASLHRMMAKTASERYQNCLELIRELAQVLLPPCAVHSKVVPSAELRLSGGNDRSPDAALVPTVTFIAANRDTLREEATYDEPANVPVTTDSDTLVHRPTTGVPAALLYLIPVMAMLVLGGVYFGIRIMREQFAKDPIVIVRDGDKQPSDVEETYSPIKPQITETPIDEDEHSNADATPDTDKDVAPDQSVASNPDQDQSTLVPETTASEQSSLEQAIQVEPITRAPRIWRVGRSEEFSDIRSVWELAGSGDTIELANDVTRFEVGSLSCSDKKLSVVAAHVQSGRSRRPAVYIALPTDTQRGVWCVERGSLTISGLDLWIDVAERTKPDAEIVLVELLQADLLFLDSSVTVIRRGTGRYPVTLFKIRGERPFNPANGGDAPSPITVEVRDSLIRGPTTAFWIDSRHAVVRLEQSLLCSTGELIHFYHTQRQETLAAFDKLEVELAASTIDTAGPLVTIDCRPPQLDQPAPMTIKATDSLLLNTTSSDLPPLILWQSLVNKEIISESIHWDGRGNSYWQRGEGLKVKMNDGPIFEYVLLPDDWKQQGLGEEIGSRIVQPSNAQRSDRAQKSLHERLVEDYSLFREVNPSTRESEKSGADEKHVPKPRSLPKK